MVHKYKRVYNERISGLFFFFAKWIKLKEKKHRTYLGAYPAEMKQKQTATYKCCYKANFIVKINWKNELRTSQLQAKLQNIPQQANINSELRNCPFAPSFWTIYLRRLVHAPSFLCSAWSPPQVWHGQGYDIFHFVPSKLHEQQQPKKEK